ncbi:MAG: nitroreductase family protein [Bauldia sp.]|nr:nitroreductase family protein [Bauldia sp.]
MDTTWKARIPGPIRSSALWSFAGKAWRRFRRTVQMPRSLHLFRNFAYDARRYARYSVPVSEIPRDRETLGSHLTFQYHKLEKGLSLPHPKPGFGAEAIRKVTVLAREFGTRFGEQAVLDSARGAVRSVVEAAPADIEPYVIAPGFLGDDRSNETGGILEVTRQEIHESSRRDLSGFFAHRYSVRDFDDLPVDPELLARALAMAQKAPSVCNRQSGRAHVFMTPKKMQAALAHQNGNRGFGFRARAVLVITSDLRAFVNAGERNQCWVDGGLFAMSVVYALHSLGLGCCMLNWSMEAAADKAMRREMGIPDCEAVITMMAVGHLKERFKVARSHRRPLHEIAHFDVAYPA